MRSRPCPLLTKRKWVILFVVNFDVHKLVQEEKIGGLEKANNVKKAAAVGKGVSSLTEKVGLVVKIVIILLKSSHSYLYRMITIIVMSINNIKVVT